MKESELEKNSPARTFVLIEQFEPESIGPEPMMMGHYTTGL